MLVNCIYIPSSYSFLFDGLDGVRSVALSWEAFKKNAVCRKKCCSAYSRHGLLFWARGGKGLKHCWLPTTRALLKAPLGSACPGASATLPWHCFSPSELPTPCTGSRPNVGLRAISPSLREDTAGLQLLPLCPYGCGPAQLCSCPCPLTVALPSDRCTWAWVWLADRPPNLTLDLPYGNDAALIGPGHHLQACQVSRGSWLPGRNSAPTSMWHPKS